MSLNESIVEDAALTMPGASLTRPVPAGEENREAIRRLNPAATDKEYLSVQTNEPKP